MSIFRKVGKRLNYDAVFQKAHALAAQRAAAGEPVSNDTTVCVISSQSGTLYFGLSRYENLNGLVHNVHAEAEAIRNMQGGNEAVIQALLLLSVSSGTPILPCEHCLKSVLALHSGNIATEILMADRAVPITELVEDAEKFVRRDKPMAEGSLGGGVLMNHINSLLSMSEEEEEPEEEESKGFFGGLFKKKKK